MMGWGLERDQCAVFVGGLKGKRGVVRGAEGAG